MYVNQQKGELLLLVMRVNDGVCVCVFVCVDDVDFFFFFLLNLQVENQHMIFFHFIHLPSKIHLLLPLVNKFIPFIFS